jgi:hypothetical protein
MGKCSSGRVELSSGAGVGRQRVVTFSQCLKRQVRELWPAAGKLRLAKTRLRTQLDSLLAHPKSYAVIVGRPNTARAVLRRIALVERVLQSVL